MAKRETSKAEHSISTPSFPIFTIGLETLAMLQHHHVSKLFFQNCISIFSFAFPGMISFQTFFIKAVKECGAGFLERRAD